MQDDLNPSRNAADAFSAPSEATGTSAGTGKPTGPEEPIDSGNPSGPETPTGSADPSVPADSDRADTTASARPEARYVSLFDEVQSRMDSYDRVADDPEGRTKLLDLMQERVGMPLENSEEAVRENLVALAAGPLYEVLMPAALKVMHTANNRPDALMEKCSDSIETLARILESSWIHSAFENRYTRDGETLSSAESYELFLGAWEDRLCEPFHPLLFVTSFPVVSALKHPLVRTSPVERQDRNPFEPLVVIGVDAFGLAELLHVEAGGTPVDWKAVFSDLRERGLEDLFCVFHDAAEGVAEGVTAVFPKARVFKSPRRMVEESVESLPDGERGKVRPAVVNAFRTAPDPATGLKRLSALWQKKAPGTVEYWRENLSALDDLFALPAALRAMAFSTDPLELVENANCELKPCPSTTLLLPYVLLRCHRITRRPVPHWSALREALMTVPGVAELMDRHLEEEEV